MPPDSNGKKKSAKQCRERWFNVIKPIIENHLTIDEERELILFLLCSDEEYKNKWVKIANKIGKTSENGVKNHYYTVLRKELRRLYKMRKPNFPNPQKYMTNELKIDLIDSLLKEYNIGIEKLHNSNLKFLIGKKRNERNPAINVNSFRDKFKNVVHPRNLNISKLQENDEKFLFSPSSNCIFQINPEIFSEAFNYSNLVHSLFQDMSLNHFTNDLDIHSNIYSACQNS